MKTKKLFFAAALTLSFALGTLSCFAQPSWIWALREGNSTAGIEHAHGVATDGSGNVYVTGDFTSASITFGGTTISNGSTWAGYVVKYNSAGTFQWVQGLGSAIGLFGLDVAVDANNDIYVTGDFSGGFLRKYNPTGGTIWTAAASSIAHGDGVATDASNNVYAVGSFLNASIAFGGLPSLSNAGGGPGITDMYLVKYNSAGTAQWARRAGGTDYERANGAATDVGGNVYVTGSFKSTSITFSGLPALSNSGGDDMYLVKYDPAGTAQWAISDGTWAEGMDVVIGSDGFVYVTGAGSSINEMFFAKYDPSTGASVCSSTASDGSFLGITGEGIDADGSGNLYVTGNFGASTTFGATLLTSVGGDDIFLTTYNSGCAALCATNVGGSSSDNGLGIDADAGGNVHIAGYFSSTSMIVGATNLIKAGGSSDIYVAKGACVGALPITLLTFTGACTPSEKAAVKLQWSTASETNNDYFTIERAADAVSWEKAGTVKGVGNSSTQKNYEFTDNTPLSSGEESGVRYYRLSQTDYDGTTETFNNKQVAVDVTECATQVFPNPVRNQLNVPYAAAQDGEIVLEVYDVIGKLVKDKTVTATKGRNTFMLDLSTVAQGMYILKITDETGKKNNQKFVKQ